MRQVDSRVIAGMLENRNMNRTNKYHRLALVASTASSALGVIGELALLGIICTLIESMGCYVRI